MTKPDKIHYVIRMKQTGVPVKMRRYLAHQGSWDTSNKLHVNATELISSCNKGLVASTQCACNALVNIQARV